MLGAATGGQGRGRCSVPHSPGTWGQAGAGGGSTGSRTDPLEAGQVPRLGGGSRHLGIWLGDRGRGIWGEE